MKIRTQLVVGALFSIAFVAVLVAQEQVRGDSGIVAWDRGEVLQDHRDRITRIKVSPLQGSQNLALATQDMPPGTGIPVHHHARTEEILFIYSGTGTVIVGDERIQFQAGDTVYVPPGVSHGIENPTSSVQIVGVVTPPGLEQAFREMFWHAGERPKELSDEQRAAIGEKYDNLR